jgi:hypothetical protein
VKILTVFLLCFSLNVFADHHEGDSDKKMEGMSFEEAKKMKLEKVDMMIKRMEEHKNCISSAQDKDALKACREKMMSQRKERKEQRRNKKK